MIKKYLFLLGFLWALLPINAQSLVLSPEAEISILTCSPGAELYSLFGHTAIRVNDPRQQIDIVFNYGTFDFNTPGFYLKYAQGLLPYQLTISSYPGFLRSYQLDQRSVYSQTLHLDSVEKQQLFHLLSENYQPENRSYLYNFLFDNCTTRTRDILEKSLSQPIEWNLPANTKSFWNLLDEYLQASPWVQWGIHTILGQRGNRIATSHQALFLPDYLLTGIDSATYQGCKISEPVEIIYQAPELHLHNPWYWNPIFIFGIGTFLLILLLQRFRSRAFLNTVSLLLFIFTGLVGVIIFFLGAFTEHPMTAPNWNILWANPLNLLAPFFLFRDRLPRWAYGYLIFYMVLLSIGIPVWFLAQPAVPWASFAWIILMLYICFRLKERRFSKTFSVTHQ